MGMHAIRPSIYSKMVKTINKIFRNYFNVSIKYKYRDFYINLPANHRLPEYQLTHPKYDKFLPHLVKYINESETIVDIGANVGDTLAGMVEENPKANFICIEPDDSFYQFLEKNVQLIKSSVADLNVKTLKALVGKSISNVTLSGEGGTKHAVLSDIQGIKSKPLDELISNVEFTDIRILKSDVDGFDYDVLDSSMLIVEKYGPIVYFECQFDHEYQKANYAKTLKSLESMSYCDWTVFDNFGEILVRTSDVGIINQLMDYVWRQNAGLATRTIYYFDILAVQQKDVALMDRVLNEYN